MVTQAPTPLPIVPATEVDDLPHQLIRKYYDTNSKVYRILMDHSRCVAQMALDIIAKHPEWEVDATFVYEAAMLHDIGIYATSSPGIGCHGKAPYICHGVIGAELLREEGLPRHALVCERHTGVGITLEGIRSRRLPLPEREMVPLSLEEQLICFADCFYSKSGDPLVPKTIVQIIKGLRKHGDDQAVKFLAWCSLFGIPSPIRTSDIYSPQEPSLP